MSLFQFKLQPLKLIMPWGQTDDLKLHWFGLTLGIYYLDVKGKRLFQYTNDILAHWKNETAIGPPDFYPEYQIARIYTDIAKPL